MRVLLEAKPPLSCYAAIGARIVNFRVDVESGGLTPAGDIDLPARVRFAFPHPRLPLLYAACGNGDPAPGAFPYYLCALRRDARGNLHRHGETLTLPARPIDVATDADGTHVLIPYGTEPGLSIHALNEDGTIGAQVPRSPSFDSGKVVHHVQALPSGGRGIMVSRGMKGFGGPGYIAGALKVFRFDRGEIESVYSVSPDLPDGFNPRNIDFHPTLPLAYLTLEGQHRLCVFRLDGGDLAPHPLFVRDTLAHREALRPRQDCGTLHIHPAGHTAYVANRNDGYVGGHTGASWLTPDPVPIFPGGENSIAVFHLDPASGEPTLVQHVDTRGLHPRTFTLDPTGRLLIVGNYAATRMERDGVVVDVPAGLTAFRVMADGTLAFLRNHPVETGVEKMWWSGMAG